MNAPIPTSASSTHGAKAATRLRPAILLLLALCCLGTAFGCGEPPPPPPATLAPTLPPVVATPAPPASPAPVATAAPTGVGLPVSVPRPSGWVSKESPARLVLAANQATLAGAELEGPALVVAQIEGTTSAEAALERVDLKGAKVLRKEPTTLGGKQGQMVEATLVSSVSGRGYRAIFAGVAHGGMGYLFTASAPLEQWEQAGPVLQGLLNGVSWR